MLLDYQSLTVVIHVNTFGLLLVVVVKDLMLFSIVLVHLLKQMILLFMLVVTITVSQVQDIKVIMTHYFNDTLWDGAGCVDNCCNDTTQPWFYRQLNQTTQDDIEAQICAFGPFRDRSTLIDQLELYIQ